MREVGKKGKPLERSDRPQTAVIFLRFKPLYPPPHKMAGVLPSRSNPQEKHSL